MLFLCETSHFNMSLSVSFLSILACLLAFFINISSLAEEMGITVSTKMFGGKDGTKKVLVQWS